METKSRSSFIRDLVIKIFLILLFVFLITLLFPMPNLTPFYNRIFNDNVQTMKDAAEDYFTKERMPEKVGDSSKLTLKQMLDKKLILPFLDKNGEECDLERSYVKVTKKKTEYELEVHLTCGNESNFIVEPIGCYNFCPDNSCTKEVKTDENGKVTINKQNNTPTPTNDNYKLQYLYYRTLTDSKWVTGDYTTVKQNENNDTKLVSTITQYTGQKKVTSNTTTYKQVKYAYRDKWTNDTDWTYEVKNLTDNVKLLDTRTLYTGQKRTPVDETKYLMVKDVYTDHWTLDDAWTYEVKQDSDKVKLADTRTLYTGQKRTPVDTTKYLMVKDVVKDNWTETGYQTTKYNTNDKVVLLGTRYTVRKTTNTTTGGWSSWVKDTTWRTSKPADTSDKQWSDAYNKKTTQSYRLIDSSFESTEPVTSTSDIWYKLLYIDEVSCVSNCADSTTRVYYYEKYQIVNTEEYQYMYRTYSSNASTNVDEKVVTDPTEYVKNGYTIVKYEYNYKVNNQTVETLKKWSTTKDTSDGYVYANEKKIERSYKYENLNKWVTSEKALGEYTYNVTTRKQYKYKYNNPTVDTLKKWSTTKDTSDGYKYANEKIVTRTYKYENLNKWVTSYSSLGEYTYNVTTRKQYKYRYNNPEKYIAASICTLSKNVEGYTNEGICESNTKTNYVDLGKWVDKSELGEYTHNVTTRTLYQYKYRKTTTYTESKWFDNNPENGWIYTGQTRKVGTTLQK